MDDLKIAAVQFEHKNGDKKSNLQEIEKITARAAAGGAEVVAFHECCISGYAFTRNLSKSQMLKLAEYIPEGPSVKKLIQIAKKYKVIILAGLIEKDTNESVYNTYICVDKKEVIATYRKIHPFINPHLEPGTGYTIFELGGWKCGILICYDNNIVENVRATALAGAQIIFMPHVTMCTPSTRPGAGFVDPALWHNREADPTSLRLEFDSMKGRAWLMKWLPARAYDSGIYAVFTNAIGMDDDQLKNGCSMIVDPFGDILAECRRLDSDFVIARCTEEKLILAGGYRYKMARKPELYKDIIGQDHTSAQKVVWKDKS